jgi:hypothetical protein
MTPQDTKIFDLREDQELPTDRAPQMWADPDQIGLDGGNGWFGSNLGDAAAAVRVRELSHGSGISATHKHSLKYSGDDSSQNMVNNLQKLLFNVLLYTMPTLRPLGCQ